MHGSNRRRSRRAALGALAAGALLALPLAAAAADGPRVTQATGAVEIGSGEPPAWRSAAPGEPLAAGDAVRTGPGARAELVLGTRTVRLYENSLLRIPAEAMGKRGPREVRLDQGRSIFDVLKDGRGDRFDVRTPEVVVSVKGTVFLVDAGAAGASSVSVFRGQVGVRALTQALEQEVRVRPGFTAVGGAHPIELRLNDFENPWEAFQRGAPAPKPPAARRGEPGLEKAREAARRAAQAGLAMREQRARDLDPRTRPGPDMPTRDEAEPEPGTPPSREDRDPVTLPAKRAELEKVTDVMRVRMRQQAVTSAIGAAISDQDPAIDAALGTPFLGDGSFTYENRDGDLALFREGQPFTMVGDDRIEQFIQEGDPRVLGSPMLQFMQNQHVKPGDVRSFLNDKFGTSTDPGTVPR